MMWTLLEMNCIEPNDSGLPGPRGAVTSKADRLKPAGLGQVQAGAGRCGQVWAGAGRCGDSPGCRHETSEAGRSPVQTLGRR